MVAPLVSDEVWQQLDPNAGQLQRRTVWRLRVIVGSIVVVALLGGVILRSGVVVPRVAWAHLSGFAWSADPVTRRVEFNVPVRNDGWTPVEVLSAGRAGPGLALVEVRSEFPRTLEPGDIMEIVLAYHVTDCAATPRGPWPIPVTVDRPWGPVTVEVTAPYLTSPNTPNGARSYVGRDPYAQEWQEVLTDVACAR